MPKIPGVNKDSIRNLMLLDKEHSYCTGKYDSGAAEADIRTLAACVPLYIGLAEQIYTHQRNTKVNCPCPNIKYL